MIFRRSLEGAVKCALRDFRLLDDTLGENFMAAATGYTQKPRRPERATTPLLDASCTFSGEPDPSFHNRSDPIIVLV